VKRTRVILLKRLVIVALSLPCLAFAVGAFIVEDVQMTASLVCVVVAIALSGLLGLWIGLFGKPKSMDEFLDGL
jgi:hypothetical protein